MGGWLGGWPGGEKLGKRLISASRVLGLAELGRNIRPMHAVQVLFKLRSKQKRLDISRYEDNLTFTLIVKETLKTTHTSCGAFYHY